jgi:hypothetical protein
LSSYGIIDFYDKDFIVYPNPVNAYVYVGNNSENATEFELVNGAGKKFTLEKNRTIPAGDTQGFKVDHLPKGIYYIRFSNEVIKKFIKI